MLNRKTSRGVAALINAPCRWGLMVILTLVALAVMSDAGLAREDRVAPDPDIRIPVLGVHRFTPNSLTGDPFLKTYIRNSLGIGQAVDQFVPLIEIGDPPERVIGLKGNLLKAILEFEYQQKVKDWVAFRVQARVTGRLGTGAQSLLASGVTANTGFEFAWLFKLAQGEKTALSGTVNIWNNSITIIDFLGFVDGILDPPQQPLVKTSPVTRGGFGLRYAWAASDLVGLTFKSDTGMGESVDRSVSDEWFINFATAVDFDLQTKMPVPLGLVFAYKVDSFPETGEDLVNVQHDLLLRVAYTGTTDFLLSLDFTYNWFKVAGSDDTTQFTSIMMNMRYYF